MERCGHSWIVKKKGTEQHRLREAVVLSGRSIGEGQAHIFPVG